MSEKLKPRHGTRFRGPAARFLSYFKYIRMTSAKASVSIIFRNGCPSSYLLEPSSISTGVLHGFTCEIPSSCSLELGSFLPAFVTALRADFLPHEADVSEGEADDDFHDHGDEVRPDLEEGLSEAQVRSEGAVLVLDE